MTFRLRAPGLDFYVDVRLRGFEGRWVAVADIAGDQELGWLRPRQSPGRCRLSVLMPALPSSPIQRWLL
jgi:hypothetical protein